VVYFPNIFTINFGARKVEVLKSLIIKITAKAIDTNDIFVDVSVTAATTINTLAIEMK